MENPNLSFNSCKVAVRTIVGRERFGTGFIYKTSANSLYDYVFTAAHLLALEPDLTPDLQDVSKLNIITAFKDISYAIDLKSKYKQVLILTDKDFAVVKIPKIENNKLARFQVRDFDENTPKKLKSYSYISFSPERSWPFTYQDPDLGTRTVEMRADRVDSQELRGISGSGITDPELPFLYGVISKYPLYDFKLSRIELANYSWQEVNKLLEDNHWEKIDIDDIPSRKYSKEKKQIIDIEELEVNDVFLNFQRAMKLLAHDCRDDWFFDPIRFRDRLRWDYVMDFFEVTDNRNYHPEKYEVFYLPKEKPVMRKAMVGRFIDQLVYIALVDKLSPIIIPKIMPCVYSARINQDKKGDNLILSGVTQWKKLNYLLDDWAEECKTGKDCLVKVDLLNYYDSINKKKLIELLKMSCDKKNEELMAVVQVLDSFLSEISEESEKNGIPQQSDASAVLATFYLMNVDEYMSLKAKHYCRFMDDIYFVAENKYKARWLMRTLEAKLRELDLSVNSQKVDIVCGKKQLEKFQKELSLFDRNIESIKMLSKSSLKADRMKAAARLLNVVKHIKFQKVETDRLSNFCLIQLSQQPLRFFDKKGESDLTKIISRACTQLIDVPTYTTHLCHLIGINIPNLLENNAIIKKTLIDLVTDSNYYLCEWQLFQLWLLLAHLKIKDDKLIEYSVRAVEENPENQKITISAMIIYLASVVPKYCSTFAKMKANGNYQKRIVQIATRNLNPEIYSNQLDKLEHDCLFRYSDERMILLRYPSAFEVEGENDNIFYEIFSGI